MLKGDDRYLFKSTVDKKFAHEKIQASLNPPETIVLQLFSQPIKCSTIKVYMQASTISIESLRLPTTVFE